MILKQCSLYLNYGGFIDFNTTTISNTKHWIDYLTQGDINKFNIQYEKILEYLSTNIDKLDFDLNNKNDMEYFIDLSITDKNKFAMNQIPLEYSSKYYAKLCMFKYIGVKYYDYQLNDDDGDDKY